MAITHVYRQVARPAWPCNPILTNEVLDRIHGGWHWHRLDSVPDGAWVWVSGDYIYVNGELLPNRIRVHDPKTGSAREMVG